MEKSVSKMINLANYVCFYLILKTVYYIVSI